MVVVIVVVVIVGRSVASPVSHLGLSGSSEENHREEMRTWSQPPDLTPRRAEQ